MHFLELRRANSHSCSGLFFFCRRQRRHRTRWASAKAEEGTEIGMIDYSILLSTQNQYWNGSNREDKLRSNTLIYTHISFVLFSFYASPNLSIVYDLYLPFLLLSFLFLYSILSITRCMMSCADAKRRLTLCFLSTLSTHRTSLCVDIYRRI